MLDQIIENIISKIHREVVQQPGMDNIPLTYIHTRNIPDSVKHFFDQEVELWLREESEKFSSSDRFDYDMPEVRVLIDKIFDILKQTATFHINQFNRLLERAIKLEANYLIRPHQTLSQFLFRNNLVITTMEVYDTLKYFDKFQYYKDALTDYFNLKYLREISQTQFEELIAGIDQQVFSKNKLETTLQTVKIIVNYLNEGRSQASDSIPTDILHSALKERNLSDYADLIEKEIQDGTEELQISQLEQILRSGKTLKAIRQKPVSKGVKLEEIEDIEQKKPEVAVESISVSEKTVIEEPEEAEEEYVEEEEEEEDILAASPRAADLLAEMMGQKMRGESLADVQDIISSKQRKKFVKKIFRKNENRYQQFLDVINKTPDWKRASVLIEEYFSQASINPYSKEALEFSDLIYNRYFPKDIGIKKAEF